jgi:hypothetical protein
MNKKYAWQAMSHVFCRGAILPAVVFPSSWLHTNCIKLLTFLAHSSTAWCVYILCGYVQTGWRSCEYCITSWRLLCTDILQDWSLIFCVLFSVFVRVLACFPYLKSNVAGLYQTLCF